MSFLEYKKYHDILKLIVEIVNKYNKNSLLLKGVEVLDIPVNDLSVILTRYIGSLNKQEIGNIVGKAKKENIKYDIDLISKLLINGWYDECAYHDPFVEEPTKMIKPESEESFKRLKFPSWRIAQAYYSIYHTVAAVVRLKEYAKDQSHNLILRSFTSHFSSELDSLFMYPFCCYIKNEKFVNSSGLDYKEEEYKQILYELHRYKKQKGKADSATTNFLHIFRSFREWCNYNAGEVLILFRSKHLRDYLDINLRTLIYLINGMNEIYLIKFLGYERVVDIFEDFYKSTMANLKFKPETICSRFMVYEDNISRADDRFELTNKAKNRYRKESDIEILNQLGKDYFSKSWLFHAGKIFNDILKIDNKFEKAKTNLDKIYTHIQNLGNTNSIPYKTEYFEDKSAGYTEISREILKRMKRERKEKAKSLGVRIGSNWSEFFVLSQSNPKKEYEISFVPQASCNCKDFKFRRRTMKECKHISAARPIWNNMQLV